MIKSMTGYGRGEASLDGTTYTVEIKSVNHRFFEFSCREPRVYSFLEEKLKSFFAAGISRGKIDVFVDVRSGEANNESITLNKEYAKSYISALKKLKSDFGLSGKISLELVAANNQVFSVTKNMMDEDSVWNTVKSAAETALKSFVEMRMVEGEKLKSDVKGRCDSILEKVTEVEKRTPETVNKYRERLEQKMLELLGDRQVDEQRLLTETAIFADKVAVDEETVRLRSHISQLEKLIDSDEPVGRKIDFVVQEMNREANTIGSKCTDIDISHIVVEIKAEIEKIREQIQNIE